MVQTTIDKKENAPGRAAAVFTGRSGRGEDGRHGASTCLCCRRVDGGSPQQRAGNGTARSRAGAEARGKKVEVSDALGEGCGSTLPLFFFLAGATSAERLESPARSAPAALQVIALRPWPWISPARLQPCLSTKALPTRTSTSTRSTSRSRATSPRPATR